jgi:hypothetical protein
MALARKGTPTRGLAYSWNEGANFTECLFTSSADVVIDDVLAEPSSVTQEFLLLGVITPDNDANGRNGDEQGYIAHVDFGSLHERACTDDDYSLWTPSFGGECYQGRHESYKRRKQFAECYNAMVLEDETVGAPCDCVRADYVCDECYMPTYNLQMPLSPPVCTPWWQCFSRRWPTLSDADVKAIVNGQKAPPNCHTA